MKRIYLLLFGILYSVCTSAQESLELPVCTDTAFLRIYTGFTLEYSPGYKNPRWVAYELTAEEVLSTMNKRINTFREDRSIPGGTASNGDYYKSGFDKGHLAPAADMRFSAEAMRESFLFSNICPQTPELNRRIWADLEAIIRYWAIVHSKVFIVTGPIYDHTKSVTIGSNTVHVPAFFFKAILVFNQQEQKVIAFIIPNTQSHGSLTSYCMSVDEAETRIGFDLFCALEDDIENMIESSVDRSRWEFIRYHK